MKRFLLILALPAIAIGLAACSPTAILNAVSSDRAVDRTRDIAYGEGERRRYDLYRPLSPNGAPPIIFFYGGSWDSGKKERYEFVGNALANRGFTVAIADYRIYPQTRFPGFVEDGAQAVAAISRDVAGGGPVVLSGHSAGAHIAALLTYDPSYLNAAGLDVCSVVAGFVGLAGPYDFEIDEPRYERIFPPDLRPQSQPIRYAEGAAPPSLLIHGRSDTVVRAAETEAMADALRRAGNPVETILYDDVGHATLIGSFAFPLRGVAPTLADMAAFVGALSVPPRCGGA